MAESQKAQNKMEQYNEVTNKITQNRTNRAQLLKPVLQINMNNEGTIF